MENMMQGIISSQIQRNDQIEHETGVQTSVSTNLESKTYCLAEFNFKIDGYGYSFHDTKHPRGKERNITRWSGIAKSIFRHFIPFVGMDW